MYADDTGISYSSKDINKLDSELDSLKHWLMGNTLSLNVIKTQASCTMECVSLFKIFKTCQETASKQNP